MGCGIEVSGIPCSYRSRSIKVRSYLEVLDGFVDSLLKRIHCRSTLDSVVTWFDFFSLWSEAQPD